MTPVDDAYISYTQTFPQKEFFATKNIFFLLICLHLHLIKSHQGEHSTTMLVSSTMSYYFNTILIYKFRLGSNPRITSSITGCCVDHYTIGMTGGNTCNF